MRSFDFHWDISIADVDQMKEAHGVTEELKMQNQMAWVGRMNNIRACAEEIVEKEIVYA